MDFGIESFASLSVPKEDYIPYNANNKQAWDAEFDTLYFTGSSGQLKFKPSGAQSEAIIAQFSQLYVYIERQFKAWQTFRE